MFIGIGVGIGRNRFAQGIFDAYNARVVADGGITEAGNCVNAVSSLLQTASLLLIPSGYKSGKAYAEIPTNGNGDLTWTRASTALRTNSSGLLESMGSGVPRLSYMYGSCPALLLEPQRTNLCLYSQDFDNAAWVKVNSSVTANSTTSPDGTTNADTFSANGTTAVHALYRAQSVTSGVAYTFSCYVKANTGRYVLVRNMSSSTVVRYGIAVDLQNGTVTQTSSTATAPTGTSNSVTSVGNGWYRIAVTMNSVDTSYGYIVLSSNTGTPTLDSFLDYSYNGTESYYIYGAQLEAGAYPTTYIPTTTASATRIADTFSRNNIYTNGLISASGGTWFVELRNNISYVRDSSASGLSIGDVSGNNFQIRCGSSANRLLILKTVSSSNSSLYTTTTSTTKIAIKWNGSTADVFVNGTKVVSATAFTATQLENLLGDGADVPKFIQAMALYPTPLSDIDCTTITSL